MSSQWSSEVSKWEFRDAGATSMSVDRTGNHVLLAGKRCLTIKRIDSDELPRKVSRQSKYDVAGAEWCQTAQGRRLCAVSSNQRVDVYHFRNGDLTGVHSLRGHTRAVSDTHWHREDHNLIATCSIDTFTHLWDLRDPRKPATSLSAVAGASQVQWNKVSGNLLATAHDGDVKLWDRRKGASPVQYISAHLCKIHGLDWSPHHEYRLATSSHDGTVKFFDINSPRRAESAISTDCPVWRATHTPFGDGLATTGVGWGGTARASDRAGTVTVWADAAPVHRFVGHSDVVLQMQWRPDTAPSDYQLLTWSRDQTLRLWSVRPSLLKMCSHYLPDDGDGEDDRMSESLSFVSASETSESNVSETGDAKMVKIPNQESYFTLPEELEMIKSLDKISLQDINLECKICIVRVQVNNHVAVLRMAFSSSYPSDGVIPKFSWLSGTNLDTNSTIKILQSINLAAHQKIRLQSSCVMHCLRVLCNCLEQIPIKLKEDRSSSKLTENSNSESSDQTSNTIGDHCIPFPRTCGAKWCGVGILVVFTRPPNAKRLSLKPESTTPRSLSSLSTPIMISGNYRSLSPHITTSPSPTNLSMSHMLHRPPTHSITTFYFQDRWKTPSRRSGSGLRTSAIPHFSPKITIYKIDLLFNLSKTLAENYKIKSDLISEMCEHNASAAASIGRTDLMQSWQLAKLTAVSLEQKKKTSIPSNSFLRSDDEEDNASWSLHPFGSNIIQALIDYYAKISDIQMAAMLCCAFSSYFGTSLISSKSGDLSTNSNGSGSSPYNTINNISEISTEGWSVPVVKPDNPWSWSDSTEMNQSFCESSLQGKCLDNAITPILDSSTVYLYQSYMRVYADILHRWNLLDARAEMMKHVSNGEDTKHNGVELMSECQRCKMIMKGSCCTKCLTVTLNCVICNIGVRGSANACLICGHGGHTKHLEEWFSKYDICPSGCGCKCLHETGNMMER